VQKFQVLLKLDKNNGNFTRMHESEQEPAHHPMRQKKKLKIPGCVAFKRDSGLSL
jgi:hypothetical protein